MFARQTTLEADTGRIDEAINAVRENVLPAIEDADGFKGFTLLVDRDEGIMIGTSYWESLEALEESESAVRDVREATARAAGATAPDVRRLEVAIDTEA